MDSIAVFSPLAAHAKEVFSSLSEPLIINYRVNAGFIPKEHWIQTEEGGGRIIGEVCHFIDFLQFITDAQPVNVFAESVSNSNIKMNNHDNIVITISFSNGSLGVITYLACGDKSLDKEYIEIFGGGKSYIIRDFSYSELYQSGSRRSFKKPGKGFKEELDSFFQSIRDGRPSPIPLDSILFTTASTFRVVDSLQTGLPQKVFIP